MEISKTLKALSEANGVTGAEQSAADVACALLQAYVPDASVDAFGTVSGKIVYDDALPTMLLDAHIDEVGLIVHYIDDKGFVHASRCGGADCRVLPAQTVTIWGERPIKGVISTLPPHVQKDTKKAIKDTEIFIDTGFGKEELEGILSLGDRITVDVTYRELLCNRITGKAMDDRAGVVSILYALELLQAESQPQYNLAVVFSSQEEVGLRGAEMAAYRAEADFAIAVDVSFGTSPDVPAKESGKLGGGVMIGIAPTLDNEMFSTLKQLSEENDIPYQVEVMTRSTGTNIDAITLSRGGVRAALLSIPERNMHMPVEVVELSDIEAVGRLIAKFVCKQKAVKS